jgi:hypothetical protein
MRTKYLIPIVFTIIYMCLPTHNSGIDGYAYASSIRWGVDLIWPHHLLYSPLGRGIYLLMPFIEPLILMKLVNAFIAGSSLFVLQRILNRLQINNSSYFVLFTAACFGFMRFATENETYIIPIFFSLLGSAFYLKYIHSQKKSSLIFSGFLFGIGVLFHQIHAMWYLGFICAFWFSSPRVNWKSQLLFVFSGGFLILSIYILVFFQDKISSDKTFFQFLLSDVYAGRVQTGININNFIMTPISFIRTFIQVHGYMWKMFTDNPVLFVLPLTLLTVVFIGIKTIVKHSKFQTTKNALFSTAIFIAFLMQLGFAFYSVGNAEFMAMLPFLIILWIACKVNITTKPILYISVAMLFWNLVFGLAPARFLELDPSNQILQMVETNPKDIWVLNDPQKIENMANYKGNSTLERIILREDELQNYPEMQKGEDGGRNIFTDILGSNTGVNRQSLLSKRDGNSEFENFKIIPVDTIYFYGGQRVLSRLAVQE